MAIVDVAAVDQPLIDVHAFEEAITPATRAVIVLHYGGHAADITRICQVARQHGVAVLEDACHGLATVVGGKALGTWARRVAFLFLPTRT